MFWFSFASDTDTVKQNALITPWTYIHILSGIVMATFLQYGTNYSKFVITIIVLIIHSIYEINDLRYYYTGNSDDKTSEDYKWKNNSFVNTIGDTIAAILGVYISFYLSIQSELGIILLVLVHAIKAGLFRYHFNYD
jgi:hypothetical protein